MPHRVVQYARSRPTDSAPDSEASWSSVDRKIAFAAAGDSQAVVRPDTPLVEIL
jgi:hypothetical protein